MQWVGVRVLPRALPAAGGRPYVTYDFFFERRCYLRELLAGFWPFSGEQDAAERLVVCALCVCLLF